MAGNLARQTVLALRARQAVRSGRILNFFLLGGVSSPLFPIDLENPRPSGVANLTDGLLCAILN